jgi:hypothetical protein
MNESLLFAAAIAALLTFAGALTSRPSSRTRIRR